MQKPTIHNTKIVHQNPWSLVRCHSLTWPNGTTGDYFVFELPAGCCVIALKDNQIMTVTQYRLPIDMVSTEIPMGRIEPNETPEQGAIRECEEEAGLKPLNLQKIGVFYPANGAVKLAMHVFVCTQFEPGQQKFDPGEEGLTKQWIPLETWRQLIKNQQISDGDTLAAWAIYLAQNN